MINSHPRAEKVIQSRGSPPTANEGGVRDIPGHYQIASESERTALTLPVARGSGSIPSNSNRIFVGKKPKSDVAECTISANKETVNQAKQSSISSTHVQKCHQKLTLPEEIKETEYMSAIQRQKVRVSKIRRCIVAATVIQRAWRNYKDLKAVEPRLTDTPQRRTPTI